ncbi:CASP C terminal-domain-containing protein [Halteromyces radiatus]|uniref:CASP C terminal-domain-containing protein n=1 Tax=Halteromyces radiatus TaxID=101107 RepID=UPI00221FACA4|nr:CASP C terminal-domain-containing protein [Halteromyces radiatus]KAI8093690.1 CASP C terminal-domain-containing protein [Halteromyces radiatus]
MEKSNNNFSTAIQFWKGVNLSTLQQDLDEQGLAIVGNQKDGLLSRKKLAEQTREFKKMSDEEKLQQLKALLKGYQSEIDSITRRTKYAENSFLTIYKLLADAPDPTPLFEAAVEQSGKLVDHEATQQQTLQLQRELEEAKQQLEQYQTVEKQNKELRQINTELKKSISKLETKVEEKKTEDLAQKEQEMKNQYNDKIRSYKEREHDLQLQLNQALDQWTQLRATHDDTQAQLISHNQKYDQEVVGKLAELDIIMMDLERANARIVELEKKSDDLKNELVAAIEAQQDQQGGARTDIDAQHELEINKLIKDVETYKDLLQKSEARNSKKIKDLNSEIKSLTDSNEALKVKLKGFDDYSEIKRELDIMKYVEFSTGGDDDDDNLIDFNAKDVLNKDVIQHSLEVQLMEKNKKLENDFTQLKVRFTQLQKTSTEDQTKLSTLQQQLEEQQKLVQRLEEDLLHQVGTMITTDKSNTRPSTDLSQSSSSATIGLGLDSSGQPSSPDVSSSSSSSTAMQKEDTNIKEGKTILPIVIQQRDRFRQRNAELEQKSRNVEQQLYEMRAEMDRLQQDNLKLYERLKFVHVWKEEQQRGATNRTTTIQMGDLSSSSRREFKKSPPALGKSSHGFLSEEDGTTDKYGKLYEENMNPFAQFHRKEEKRRYNALNPADKLTLKMTRMMFSHRWSRYFLIGYALLLHLLVVTTLYQLSLWECRHDHESQLPTLQND